MHNTRQLDIINRVLINKDPQYTKYIDSVSKVTLYKYTNEWIETGIIGSLYFYLSIADNYKFIILNTMLRDHFILKIDNFNYYTTKNFIILQSNNVTYGILFAEEIEYPLFKASFEDSVKLCNVDNKLVAMMKDLKVDINKNLYSRIE